MAGYLCFNMSFHHWLLIERSHRVFDSKSFIHIWWYVLRYLENHLHQWGFPSHLLTVYIIDWESSGFYHVQHQDIVITWLDLYHWGFGLKTLGCWISSPRLRWSLFWVILNGSTFVLVLDVLSSHHGSTLVSSSHDYVQSVSTTMDLHCIGRRPCYEPYKIWFSCTTATSIQHIFLPFLHFAKDSSIAFL